MSIQTPPEQRLKVLFITPWYPTEDNPLNGVFVREHAKAVQLNDDVAVLHFAGHLPMLEEQLVVKEEQDWELTEGVPTYRFRYRTVAREWLAHPVRFWNYLRAFRFVRKSGFSPDIIHANIHVVSLPAIFLGWLYRIPVVIMEHHSAFPRRSLTPRRIWEAKVAFKHASRVLPVSKALQRGIENYHIQARFQVVPNVVDMKLFAVGSAPAHSDSDICRFVCVATMPADDVKGISFLLDAAAQLRQITDGWQLQIVGDGPARPMYEEQARTLELQGYVAFLGRKSKTDVARHMREADVFVLSSIWENLPCVIIEAMASGLPIMATEVGGIPEMVDESSGILVQPKSTDALVRGMLHMLQHYKTFDRHQIAQNAQQRYNQETVGQILHTIYQECINESIH